MWSAAMMTAADPEHYVSDAGATGQLHVAPGARAPIAGMRSAIPERPWPLALDRHSRRGHSGSPHSTHAAQ